MMDGLERRDLPDSLHQGRRVMLLPGSRLPEALGNLQRLLGCLPEPEQCTLLGGVTVLVPISGALFDSSALAQLLAAANLRPEPPPPRSQAAVAWRNGALRLLLGPGCFSTWASWAEVGLATAGTATEQLVGLGVPALSLPGPGPQFTQGFARRQSRLLGGAVHPCKTPEQLRERLMALLQDGQISARLGRKGRQRMGPAGGSEALAWLVEDRLLRPVSPPPPRVAG